MTSSLECTKIEREEEEKKEKMEKTKQEWNGETNQKTLRSNGVRHGVNSFRASHISLDSELFLRHREKGQKKLRTHAKEIFSDACNRHRQQEVWPREERMMTNGNFNVVSPTSRVI